MPCQPFSLSLLFFICLSVLVWKPVIFIRINCCWCFCFWELCCVVLLNKEQLNRNLHLEFYCLDFLRAVSRVDQQESRRITCLPPPFFTSSSHTTRIWFNKFRSKNALQYFAMFPKVNWFCCLAKPKQKFSCYFICWSQWAAWLCDIQWLCDACVSVVRATLGTLCAVRWYRHRNQHRNHRWFVFQ